MSSAMSDPPRRTAPSPDAIERSRAATEEVRQRLADLAEVVGVALLGEPTLRRGAQWRWGSKGSLALAVQGEKRGVETVVTKLIRMPNEAIRNQATCIAESIPVPVDLGEWDRPLEDPGWRDLLRQDLSDLTDRRIGPAIVTALEAQLDDPVTAERRLQALAAQLRVSPDVVAEVGERLKLRRPGPG